MKTFQFSFKGRSRFIDGLNIFDALTKFHAFYEGIDIKELHIIQIAEPEED